MWSNHRIWYWQDYRMISCCWFTDYWFWYTNFTSTWIWFYQYTRLTSYRFNKFKPITPLFLLAFHNSKFRTFHSLDIVPYFLFSHFPTQLFWLCCNFMSRIFSRPSCDTLGWVQHLVPGGSGEGGLWTVDQRPFLLFVYLSLWEAWPISRHCLLYCRPILQISWQQHSLFVRCTS